MFRQQLLDCQGVLDQLIEDVNKAKIDGVVILCMRGFSKKTYGRSNRSSHKITKNACFDDRCKEARENFKRARNIFSKNKNAIKRHDFINA